jgi:hypothetical protein
MDMKLAKQVATLIAEKRGLEDSLRAVKDQIAKLEPELLNMLMEEQMDRLHVTVGDQKITLYIHRIMWAKPKDGDRETVVATLKRCGMSDFVTESYNSNSLSAYVRERLSNGTQLQPTLSDALNLEEVVSIRGRRSSATPESKTAKAMKTTRRQIR